MPDPAAVLDAVASLGFDGISLGPPGYLGRGESLTARLASRGLQLAEVFLPLHLSRADLFPAERADLRTRLSELAAATDDASARPMAVLSDGFGEQLRWMNAGRAFAMRELELPPDRMRLLIDNIHRAAEDCRDAGFEVAFHHHAGTFVETEGEIRQVFDAIDPALLGICLDTAHACLGGADVIDLVRNYGSSIRALHLKDVSLEAIAASHKRAPGLTELTAGGAFLPLGEGDLPIADVVERMLTNKYHGWMVIEQDQYLEDALQLDAVIDDQRRSLVYLERLLRAALVD